MISNLPLVRASSLLPLLKFLNENGISSQEFTRQSKLPENIFSHSENVLSLYQAFDTLNFFARREGEELFGILASQKLEIEDIGLFGKIISQSLTGYDLLRTIVSLLKRTYSSGVKVWLTEDNDRIWFNHQYLNLKHCENQQASYYGFLSHLKAIRSIMGFDLHPTDLCFQGQTIKGLSNINLFSQCRIRFNQPYNSMGISKNLLYLPLEKKYHHSNDDEQNLYERMNLLNLPVDFVDALKLLIRSQLFGGNIQIQTIVDSVGTSKRSLQRCLAHKGLSYSHLLNQVRFQLAVEYLKDNTIKIGDIAFELNYSEVNNFTRAFKKWTGLTPSEYRHRL
ncbi:helix-turn-helix domain-containing protein [Geminocystis sp.]|uniref:AraC family transcriptional regulator n=1 Tax=Geminocystis sp. TaxID=2664100 RepID=UPI003593A43C